MRCKRCLRHAGGISCTQNLFRHGLTVARTSVRVVPPKRQNCETSREVTSLRFFISRSEKKSRIYFFGNRSAITVRVFKGANEVSMSGLNVSGTKVKVSFQKRSDIFRDLIKFRDLIDGMKI